MTSPGSPLLPPFGIRHLNGTELPPSLVQISSRQYDEAIRSQPDATLQYHDDDDGEIITVGTSFELGQRLDEPVKPGDGPEPSSSVPVPNPTEGTPVHIFDISKPSNASLAVWKVHEAWKSGPLGVKRKAQSLQDSSVEDMAFTPSPVSEQSPQTKHLHAETAQLDDLFVNIIDSLSAGLEPLADILETTAKGIRATADKTNDTDTTPVEVVLSGFKGIFTEVGRLGVQVLTELEELNHKHTASRLSPPANSAQPDLPLDSLPESSRNPPSPKSRDETLAKRVSFADDQSHDAADVPQTQARIYTFADPTTSETQNQDQPTVESETAPKPSLAPSHPPLKPSRPVPQHSTRTSILDLENHDHGFSVRFPPLMSLRKAKSVGGLHDSSFLQRPSLSTSSALHRYPSVSQLEEQSRQRLKERIKDGISKSPTMPQAGPPLQNTMSIKRQNNYRPPSVEDDVEKGLPRAPQPRGPWPGPGSDQPGASGRFTGAIFPRRTQTVSGTNPAARLNGPFDPLSHLSTVQPRAQKSVPQLRANPPPLVLRPRQSQPSLPNPPSLATSHRSGRPSSGTPKRSHTVSYTDRYKPHAEPLSPARPSLWEAYQADSPGTAVWPDALGGGKATSSATASTAPPAALLRSGAAAGSGESQHVVASALAIPEPGLDGAQPGAVSAGAAPLASTVEAQPFAFGNWHTAAQVPLRYNPLPFHQPSTSTAFSNVTLPTTTFAHNGRAGARSPPLASTRVEECIKILRELGYGLDANEASRLSIYAGAAGGDVADAIEMIEEERQAQKELNESPVTERETV